MVQSRTRILVFDDEQDILDVIRLILESEAAFEVRTTTNAGHWYGAVREFRPAIVLADYRMPELTGDALIRALRHSDLSAGVRAVGLFSATPFSADEVQRIGADFFFEKPFEVGHILKLLLRYSEG